MAKKRSVPKIKLATRKNAHKASQEIAFLIREKRIKNQMSQADLAQRLGYSNYQYVSDWERAYSPVPLSKLIEIAKVLGLSQDRLFDLFLKFSIDRVNQELNEQYQELTKKKA